MYKLFYRKNNKKQGLTQTKGKREREREKNKMSLQSHFLFNEIDQSFRQLYCGRIGQHELNSRKYYYYY